METKGILGIKFQKIRVYLSRLFSFPEIPQNQFAAFFSALEISGNSHSVWSKGKRPIFLLVL